MIFTIDYNYNTNEWHVNDSNGGWYRLFLENELLDDRVVYVGF